MTPQITVLLPVYNGQEFLEQAVQSILHQSFKNFELLIIDDGSKDQSLKIMHRFKDKRLRIIKNTTNKGLVFCLNLGISEAKGDLIARMDADDISLPTRLEKQLAYLAKNNCAAASCLIDIIDKNGKSLGPWQEDIHNVSPDQIKNQLPKGNCLAHPTMMIKKSLLLCYGYNPNQALYTEDYDLWLKIVSDGHKIGKVNEPLLLYRAHPGSASAQTTSWYKRPQTRLIYAWSRLAAGKFNSFDAKVLFFLFPELFDYFRGKIHTAINS